MMNQSIENSLCLKKVILLFFYLYFIIINHSHCLTEAGTDTDSDSMSIISEYSNDQSCSTNTSFSSKEESRRRSFSEDSNNSNISNTTDKSLQSFQSIRGRNPSETKNIFNYSVNALKEIYKSITDDLENIYVILEQDIQKLIMNEATNSLKFQNHKNRCAEILKQIYFFQISLQRIQDILCQEIILFKIENAPEKRVNESEKIDQMNRIKKSIRLHIRTLLETANELLVLVKSGSKYPSIKQDISIKLIKNYISKLETIKYRIANIDNRSLIQDLYECNSCE